MVGNGGCSGEDGEVTHQSVALLVMPFTFLIVHILEQGEVPKSQGTMGIMPGGDA